MSKTSPEKEHPRYLNTMFLKQSLSLKIIFYIGILLVIAILISFYINNEAHEKELINMVQLQAHRLADTIKSTIRHNMIREGGHENIQKLIEAIGYREDIVKVSIIDKGKVKISSWREEIGKICTKDDKRCSLCHFSKDNRPPLTIFIHRIFSNSEGERFIEVFNPIQNEPICYQCHKKERQILGILNVVNSLSRLDKAIMAGKNVMIISTIIIFLLFSLEIFYFIYRFVHCPIQKLTQATKRVAEGDIDYHIEINSTDEIGELARAFNLMTKRLKKSWSEIEAWNLKLEKRVKEATSKLRGANEKLQIINKRLKIADQKKTKILITVAHDIRGPLSAIKSCIGVILGGYLMRDKKRQNEMLKRADQRVDELLRFTNNLLDISLIEEAWYDKKDVNCTELVDSIIPVLNNSAREKGISLVFEKEEGFLFVKGDRELLKKIFLYISENAIKYSHPKGKIYIKLSRCDGNLIFCVTDEGIGIPENEISYIFEPTYRGKLARRHTQSGTGVSMALVERIVKIHNGKILIKSKVGKGTEFKVILPSDVETEIVDNIAKSG